MNLLEWVGLISGITGIITFILWMYEKRLPYQRISWRRAERAAKEIASKLVSDRYSPTLIMGIGRGGAIFGSMISGSLGHIPLLVVDRKYKWSTEGRLDEMMFSVKIPQEYLGSILLVAGEAHSGSTMKRYSDFLRGMGAENIRRAVLFYEEGCPIAIEYFGVRSDKHDTQLPWMYSKNYRRDDRAAQRNEKTEPEFRLKIHLIRHAETSAGEDIFLGSNDADLTEKGVIQATQLSQKLFGRHIAAIYSSPLGRAKKTAHILNALLEAELVVDERLREMDFGEWEGVKRSEIQKKNKALYSKWLAEPEKHTPPAGEPSERVLERLLGFLSDVEQKYRSNPETEVIVVSHKTAIRIIQAHLTRGNLAGYRSIEVKNADPLTLALVKDQWAVNK